MKVRSHSLTTSSARAIAVLCGVVFVTSAHTAQAGINVWTSHGPGGSIQVAAVAIDPTTPATLYFGSEDGGVFKSTNAGETWSAGTGLPESTSVNALVIDFSTPRTVYAGTAGGIFKSTDGGGTWSAINTGLPDNGDARDVFALAIDPKTPTTLYA